jgi:hypothetical protein
MFLHRVQVISTVFFLFSLTSNAAEFKVLLANEAVSTSVAEEDGFINRRASLRRMGDPKMRADSRTHPKFKSYDVLAATALKGCGPEEWSSYMAGISTMAEGSTEDEPIEKFSLPPLVRYLYQFGDCLTNQQKKSLLDGLTRKQWLTGHGTINQAIMQASSWFLLAQYFPDAIWIDKHSKKYTSQQLMVTLKSLLAGRTSRFYKSGQFEWLSPTYTMINFYPLLNLIDFARDPMVRKSAEEEANLQLAVLKQHSFHGEIVPPLTRKNSDQINAQDYPLTYDPAITQQILWYYFGEPTNLALYDFQSRRDPFYATMLGLSNWKPQGDLGKGKIKLLEGYNIKLTTPSFGIWDAATNPEIYGDTYISDDFAIGTGNLFFEPTGYSGEIQTFSILLKSNKPQNQIECYQPYWKSNAGEDAWGRDRSSPFQQMFRYDHSSVVMLFDIPKKDPWVLGGDNRFFRDRSEYKDALLQLAECRIPKSFDEIIKEKNWVFVRQGGVFVAIATMLGNNEYDQASTKLTSKYLILKVREAKTALFFRVEREVADMNFSQFREQVRKQLPLYDASTSSVAFTEQTGVHTEVKFKLLPYSDGERWSAIPDVFQNGKPLLPDDTYVIDSPVLKLKNGVLTIGPVSQGNVK